MDPKGYVLCLLKYTLREVGAETVDFNRQSANEEAVCLGYFGRAAIVPVSQFKEYMSVASEHNAAFVGSRKQIFLYPFDDELSGQIQLGTSGKLPFQSSHDRGQNCFCCLAVFNIRQELKFRLGSKGLRQIAQCFSKQLQQYKSTLMDDSLTYSVMGLLGTEDLCVIFLGNNFTQISGAISYLRNLCDMCEEQPIVENSHSILMFDSPEGVRPEWDNASAEIHVSLKTANSVEFLAKISETIKNRCGSTGVALETRLGEYDAVLRCPASVLNADLFGAQAYFSYSNPDYVKAAYQSETIICQKHNSTGTLGPALVNLKCETEVQGSEMLPTPSQEKQTETSAENIVREAIKKICQYMLSKSSDSDGSISNIQQGLQRLLKDYMRIASIPFGGTLQLDLPIQFEGAVNAVVCQAQQYQYTRLQIENAKSQFDENFSHILESMSAVLQSASQIDRLSFEEQEPHLLNTGACHKVLLSYYGIVKDILQLMYSIPRKEENCQPTLIPLLAFGHTSIVLSRQYDSIIGEKPAKLICITMPYQSLTNIPKYIGMLVHELFHYSTPTNRADKNEAAGICLCSVAFVHFLDSLLAATDGYHGVGTQIFSLYPHEFLDVITQMFKVIYDNQKTQFAKQMRQYEKPDEIPITIPSEIFFSTLLAGLIPSGGNSQLDKAIEQLYCNTWLELRKKLQGAEKLSAYMRSLLAVNGTFYDAEEAKDYFSQNYGKIGPHEWHCIKSYIKTFRWVLREIPPDLFDVNFVMYGQTPENKARQYLWQIHSSRCDKLYYQNEELGKLDGNALRIGVLLDHFVFTQSKEEQQKGFSFVERAKTMKAAMYRWFPCANENEYPIQSKSQKAVLEHCINDYEKYLREGFHVYAVINRYISPIQDQIDSLTKAPAAQQIMQRLSGFYKRYYECLDNQDEKNKVEKELFSLSIEIIEHYLGQPSLASLKKQDSSTEEVALTKKGKLPSICGYTSTCTTEFKALSPKDLSRQVVNAYVQMFPKGERMPLWFRGQSCASYKLLPGVMRSDIPYDESGYAKKMKKMITLAKAKILPRGAEFHMAEWLAFLQHYEFKTNLLDWTEDLFSALFFAIEEWIYNESEGVPEDAAVFILNPILYNFAKRLVEQEENSEKALMDAFRISRLIETGNYNASDCVIPLFAASEQTEQYKRYFDFETCENEGCYLPIAATTPQNNDRMKAQAGVFLFYDVYAKPDKKECSYAGGLNDVEHIQEKYFQIMFKLKKDSPELQLPVPFLSKIVLSGLRAKEFSMYVKAIGMRRYKVYPDFDKLAKDIIQQTFIED